MQAAIRPLSFAREAFNLILSSNQQVKTAVITGGPGAGKTSTICALAHAAPVFEEAARWVLTHCARFRGLTAVQARGLDLQRAIYERQARHFQRAQRRQDSWAYFDRGIPDSLAYLRLSRIPCPSDLRLLITHSRYDAVFILDLLPSFATDEVRTESPAEARKIEKYIWRAYREAGYAPVRVPVAPVENRVQQIRWFCSRLDPRTSVSSRSKARRAPCCDG